MKEKAIGKIPYLTLRKTIRGRKVKYIAVTAVRNISHEKHLFVEVYRNKKASMDIPVVRIVLTKKDFGNYFPEKGCWTSERILNSTYYNNLIWSDDPHYSTYAMILKRSEENVLQDESDLKRIENFCKERWKSNNSWYQKINAFENDISNKKRIRAAYNKNKRRRQALNDRARLTPELDLETIAKEADGYFDNKHYLYYRKNGSFATIGCSCCGKVFTGRWKCGMSYESQFKRSVREPVKGLSDYCPGCGAYGEYKPQGLSKAYYSKSVYAFTASAYKENGIIVRYLELKKDWQLEVDDRGKGEEIVGASEHIHAQEIARAYIEPGKDTQIDYHKYNNWTHETFWDDCNLSAYEGPIKILDAAVLPEAYEVLNKTGFKYCQLKAFESVFGRVNMIDYITMYGSFPQIEFLMKLGLYAAVKQIVGYRCGIISNPNSKKLHMFLGIKKEYTEMLLRHGNDISFLEALKAASKGNDAIFTEAQIEFLSAIDTRTYEVMGILKFMPLQKFINRVEKYSGLKFDDDRCARAIGKLSSTAQTYIDYLNLRDELGYDMENTVYLFPKELQAAHDRMVREQTEKKDDEHIKNMMSQYPEIQHAYRKLRREYYYEDDEYTIRPARSAKEIILEGRTLHHCVGGNAYLSGHNDLRSIILFLRFKKSRNTPYITVEVRNDSKNMVQWYGAHDKKPDKEHMDKWLNDYIENLKKNQSAENTLVRAAV